MASGRQSATMIAFNGNLCNAMEGKNAVDPDDPVNNQKNSSI